MSELRLTLECIQLIVSDIDPENEVSVTIFDGAYDESMLTWIKKDQAIQLIEHLKTQFEL